MGGLEAQEWMAVPKLIYILVCDVGYSAQLSEAEGPLNLAGHRQSYNPTQQVRICKPALIRSDLMQSNPPL